MRGAIRIAGLVALLAVAAANCRSAQGNGTDVRTETNRGKYYDITTVPAEIPVGTETSVVVTIVAGTGFHWNDEYPASFELTATGTLEAARKQFSTKEKSVEPAGGNAHFTIPLKAAAAGDQVIKVKGNFSVCNETSCKIMKGETFQLTVKGK